MNVVLKYSKFMDLVIQVYNCCVDMFSNDQYDLTVEWTNKTLDIASMASPSNQNEREQLNMLLKNANRLLGRN